MEQGCTTHLCNSLDGATDGEHTLMHARDDFADPSLDTGLLPQLSDVFSGLANDNACIFRADECTEGQGIVTGGRGRTRLRWRY